MRRMSRRDFEDAVREAVESLPRQFLARFLGGNVAVVVEDRQTAEQLREAGLPDGETLLGLYEGVPLVDRESYNLVPPDKITIFQAPLEEMCRTRAELVDEIRDTVVHEVAHFFGLDDRALRDLGLG
ncbi:MAG: metallopeptidase family protein [Gemmatimonadetes bacterium]|nr:metallopeptidase family protein [Gemmatimonadota bacterium]